MNKTFREKIQNLRLSKRLLLGFGTVLLLTAVLMIFSIYFVARVGSFSHLLYDGPYISTTAVESIRADINEAGIAIRNGLLEKDIEKYTDSIATSKENAFEQLKLLKEHFKGKPEYVDDLEKAIEVFGTERARVLEAAGNNDYEQAYQLLLTDYNNAFQDAISKANIVYETADTRADSYNKRATILTASAFIFMIILFIATLFLGIYISIFTTRSVVKPMRELEEAAMQMSKGNLKTNILYTSQDEMGSLADSMREMSHILDIYITDISRGMKQLAEGNLCTKPEVEFYGDFIPLRDNIMAAVISFQNAIININESSNRVNVGSGQIAGSGQVLSQSAAEQASAVEELCSTINDIAIHTENSAKNANEASKIAKDVGFDIEKSNDSMKEMVEAMSEISSTSNEISKIIKTIEGIASQTNLLSLNAAIEAARAGEAGKGFAVVAEEVRSLAEESANASKDSAVLINSSLAAVQKGMRIVEQTADSLISIVEKARLVTKNMDDISKDAKMQSRSIDKITAGVDQISATIEENSAAIEESAAASLELAEQAKNLDSQVNLFQINN